MKSLIHFLLFILVFTGLSCDKENSSAEVPKDCDAEIIADCFAHNWTEFSTLDMTVDGAHYTHDYKVFGTKSIFIYKATLNTICGKSNLVVDLSCSLDASAAIEYLGEVTINGELFNVKFTNLDGILTGHFTELLKVSNISKIEVYMSIVRLNNNLGGLTDEEWYNQNVIYHGMTLRYHNKK